MNNIQAIGNRILVLPDEPKEVTKGGIIIPDTAKRRPETGTAISVGNKISYVKAGDKVKYFTLSGDGASIEIAGVKYYFMTENEIFAVV